MNNENNTTTNPMMNQQPINNQNPTNVNMGMNSQYQNNGVVQGNMQPTSTPNMNNNQGSGEINNMNVVSQQQNIETAQANKNSDATDKAKKSYLIILIINVIIAIIRMPYLYAEYKKGIYLDSDTLNLCFLIVGIVAIILCVLALVLKNNKKTKYIVGLIAGIMVFLSGSILGNVIGILLVIDSARLIKAAN